ncbi:MAG: Trk system potassium transporter TrkA [Candidatus Bathyarchaeota archaeon]|nr:Trk system potassium transporter TrkA [Candidatus Termiticorpusculum sp.]
MRIIIVGCGKVGYTIAKILSSEEGIDVTVVDNKSDFFDNALESIDVKFLMGNGLNEKTLIEAGAKEADLIINVTDADEVNILCGIMAKHLGTKHTIARVRNPDCALEFNHLWRDLGIDMTINPEQQTAREISRLLRYQTVEGIDTFISGRIELISVKVSETSDFFVGKSVSQVFNKKWEVFLAVVERENNMLIPKEDLVFEESDVLKILGRPSHIMNFLMHIGKRPKKSQEAIIIGGSVITHYLVELLNRHTVKTSIKIIEKDLEKCEVLSMTDHRCLVIHGDGTNEEVLVTENIDKADAVICLTDRDEENTVISLYALQMGVKKVVTKVNHINQIMIQNLGLSDIITPQNITSNFVFQYVKGLKGMVGDNIRTMHKIFSGNDGNVEVIEFHVDKKSKCLNIPVKDLTLKNDILISCIVRDSHIFIPPDEIQVQAGDVVIIITKNNAVYDLDDVLVNEHFPTSKN